MMIPSKLKVLLAGALFSVSASSMAAYVDPVNGVLNVQIGAAPFEFSGKFDQVGAALNNEIDTDIWTLVLTPPNSGGTVTNTSISFNNVTGMQFFSDAGATNAVSAAAVLNNNTWTIVQWLASGTYYLKIDGIEGKNYIGEIGAVPLPAAGLLFGSVLMGAGVMGRKKLFKREPEAVAA